MASEFEKLKKNRTSVRTAVTKIVKNIEINLKDDPINISSLEENIYQLNTKSKLLKEIDDELLPQFKIEEYDAELNTAYEYTDKISLALFRANKKLKELNVNIEKTSTEPPTETENKKCNISVKLPKLNIEKFFGDVTQFTTFWNLFKVTIDENVALTKIEKFNYLRSYLGGVALTAIEGFEISDDNYDCAVNILKKKFGQKHVIINNHINKLLNLPSIYKADDIPRLKKLLDHLQVNIRCLSSLGIDTKNYSTMLIPLILKAIPPELTLEYKRKQNTNFPDEIDAILEFLENEIISRESLVFFKPKPSNSSQEQSIRNKVRPFTTKIKGASSTCEFFTAINEKNSTVCLFCKKFHKPENCNADVETKKNILKSQGRCFLCLAPYHRINECRTKTLCNFCKGRHHEAICFKKNSPKAKEHEVIENENTETKKIISAVSYDKKNRILLQTCHVKIKNNSKELNTRLICDTGSMRSFCRKETSEFLKLKPIRKEKLKIYTFGNSKPIDKTFDVVKINLSGYNVDNSNIEIEVLVTDEISAFNVPPPEFKEIAELKNIENLILADSPNSKEPITLLIGADFYYNLVTGKIKHVNKNLVAVETLFGWCLQGKNSENHTSLTLNIIVEDKLISEQIEKFWSLESSGIINSKQDVDPSENDVLKRFEADIEFVDNRYTVKLPWKLDPINLSDNKLVAENRFHKLKKRFIRNPQLFSDYKKVLDDYLEEKIIERVPNDENNQNVKFYLPHREVIKNDRTTSKLRIVYDASSHDANCLSLNNCLNVGPNLYPEIFEILLRFRLKPIAFTADMRQAFLQILIDNDDRDVSRFFFIDNPFDESENPFIYRFTRVLFGLTCSPFLLAATIKFHLKKYLDKYPETVRFLNDNVYVDDVIGSHNSVENALATSLQTSEIFKEASLNLHKFRTNSELLSELWKKEGIISESEFENFGDQNLPYKVLGIAWNNLQDSLYFEINSLIEFVSRRVNTKRFILQVLGRIFDPVGFLGPFTLRIKCLIQKIWCLTLDWDDPLPKDLDSTWEKWCCEIPHLNEFSVPRYYFSEFPDVNLATLQLHVFSDSSLKAYASVAYLRYENLNKEIRTVFVASKNRVSPLKTLTLPRLELMAALLSAKLSKSILSALKLKVPCFFWTDSKITYFWIKGTPDKFKIFVKNRVEEIQKLTSPTDWYHCSGVSNPADLATRGTKISNLTKDSVWLQGPDWLIRSPEFWGSSDIGTIDIDQLEYRKVSDEICQYQCLTNDLENPIDIRKYSSLEKLLRITVWVKKFIRKIRKLPDTNDNITTEEMLEAEKYIIQTEQKLFFHDEYESLKNGKPIDKSSPLINFQPYLDEDKIMRLGGRLEFSNFTLEEKHPIILPKKSWLSTLIVRNEHEKIMHGGVASTLAKIRSRFWIIKGRQLIKSILKKCIICKKYNCKPIDQVTAPLPKDRIQESPPFSVCGLDFAGPIYVKNFKEIQKSYIVLFTCGITRAIHLELVSDMTTHSFLLAFRRFISRRGNIKIVYSDNAKSLKKAQKEIENLSNIMSDNALHSFVTKERIVWKNIVERAAWWGGFYERLVKSVKDCLRKIVGKALLSTDEMSTLLTEVESVLNLRPLTYVYDDNDEPQPLTPSHFLNLSQEPTYPISLAEIIDPKLNKTVLLKRRKYQSLLLKQIWYKWKQQYLLDLRTAHTLKNPNQQPELKEGDVVLICEDTKNQLLWKLGRVERAFPGRDKKIRSYEVKTSNGLLRRTAQHLCPLEL